MKAYWTDTRPNGQALETGTFARVIDLEDGTHPTWVYGKSESEVWEKIELNNMHAQQALQRRASAPPVDPAAPAATVVAPRMTADQRMQAMAERDNPATAGAATARLIADDTGVDLNKLAIDNFSRIAKEWEQETPNFYVHQGNRRLISTEVARKTNGRMGLVTKPMLSEAFEYLQRRGELFEGPAAPAPHLETLPVQEPVQRVERPRGARFATEIPRNRLGSPQTAQPKTLKYTKEELDRIPPSQSRRLIEINDMDYAAACDAFYPQNRQATA